MTKDKTTTKAVRMPDDLVEAIEELANNEHRTFSGQLLYLLERGLEVWNNQRKDQETKEK